MTLRYLLAGPCFVSNSYSIRLSTRAKAVTPCILQPRIRYFANKTRRLRTAHPRFKVTASASPSTSHRLAVLREELKSRQIQAIVIPSSDPHNSEYAPACYARRAYISNFTGSAGTAVVLADGAYLWTDGRYFLQAEQQLDENWTLMKAGQPDTPTIPDFLADILSEGSIVGVDPYVHSVESADRLQEALEAVGCKLTSLETPNPVDLVWGTERPPFPSGKVRVHPTEYAGQTIQEKLQILRDEMKEKGRSHMLLSMLDEVCWAYNIRGDDIPHCPVVLSYALISEDTAALYVDNEKLDDDVEAHCKRAGVAIQPYRSVVKDIRNIAEKGQTIWLDPSSTSLALKEAAQDAAASEATPVPLAKSCKNEKELQGMRECHIRDGVALSSFLCWLEEYVNGDNAVISEVDAAEKLEEFRAAQDGFISTSFGTISGSGPNGAIIHYAPVDGECGNVNNKEVFLLDSGGQYCDGTTDVTRTMHLGGAPSDHEKECFTRVLQGHIAIDTAIFPEDTTGLLLDTLARIPLWSIGLDYRHGTGHGVGACLNVHEGPQSISPRIGSNKAGIKAGMILSNEPGYYEDGKFGIRIENLLSVVRKDTAHDFSGKQFLGFERLTFVPIDRSMIDPKLLKMEEMNWLNDYHEEVWQNLSPRMDDGKYKQWLWKNTRPITISRPQGSLNKTENIVSAAP